MTPGFDKKIKVNVTPFSATLDPLPLACFPDFATIPVSDFSTI